LRKFFSPEFLNRIDDVIVFNSLDKAEIIRILDVRMVKMLKRIQEIGYNVTLTEAAKLFLADKVLTPTLEHDLCKGHCRSFWKSRWQSRSCRAT